MEIFQLAQIPPQPLKRQNLLTGGGIQSEASKEALSQLESSKFVFTEERGKLIMQLLQAQQSLRKTLKQEQTAKTALKRLESSVTRYEVKTAAWNDQINKQLSNSQKVTKQLNEQYKSLKSHYDKWENFKRNQSIVGRYLGILKSSICNSNLRNYNNSDCTLKTT